MSREHQAAENRARMPETAKTVDAFRAAFGKAVLVVWAEEGGSTVGERRPVPRSMSVDQWTHYIKTGEQP